MTMVRGVTFACSIVAVTAALVLTSSAQSGKQIERLIVRAAKPYDALEARIKSIGGTVTGRYTYIDALAVEVPVNAVGALRSIAGNDALLKDAQVPAPAAAQPIQAGRSGIDAAVAAASRLLSERVQGVAGPAMSSVTPNAYLVNNAILGAAPLHAAGVAGQGVIVAVIDSGIRPGFPHLSSDGSVIGGEDFVNDGLTFSNPANGGHGTFVAGMISANVALQFGAASSFLAATRTYCPPCAVGQTDDIIPMIGTAPLASIYALRVFGPTGGAPTSRIFTAIERAIDLRQRFDRGASGGVNIQVVNMSLGGPTLMAGRDLLDRLASTLLDHGIVLVTSAGNAGPSSLTGGSPGTALEALTVGAASYAHNERIIAHLSLPPALGPQRGALYRPFGGVQTAVFSSRGPAADGRVDPDVTANGTANYGQGFFETGNITIGSGTSFSAPSVAGVAALLRQAFPMATARQIRNAIILSANPNLLADDSTELDQGAGFVDAMAARDLLAAGQVPDTTVKPRKPHKSVSQNVRHGTFLEPLKGNVFQRASGLKPGERADFLYEVTERTEQVVISLQNFAAALPPAQQNQLFGDDIFLAVHSAKTSSQPGDGDYLRTAFTTGGTFVVNNPEPGLLRVTVNGDTTNAGSVAVDVAIASVKGANDKATATGQIATGDTATIVVNVPAGVDQAVFTTRWRNNWSRYPTSDLDMILIDPAGTIYFDGATLNSPESVVFPLVPAVTGDPSRPKPAAGTWLVLVDGFEVPARRDKFEVTVTLDGNLVR
jgi:subtilisin family serine protease